MIDIRFGVISIIFLALSLVGSNAAAQNIDTTASATNSIFSFGVPDTATYGQTITIPVGSTNISKFGFKMLTVPSTVAFRGEVYGWDQAAGKATGSALYESAVTQTTGATSQVVMFTPSSPVPVTAGQKYVIFVSTARDQTGYSGAGSWAWSPSDNYIGGDFVYLNNGTNPSDWTTQSWSSFSGSDLGFITEFDAVPVPTLSQWALIVLGPLLGLFALIQLRRSRPTAA